MASRKRTQPSDLSTQILVEIRDELRTTRAELVEAIGRTNDRLDQTVERLDRLEQRVTSSEIRFGTQHIAIIAALEKLQATMADALSRDAAINDLDERVSVLEEKAGVRQ